MIRLLEDDLPPVLPGLNMNALNGEYIEMLQKANALSTGKKLVLFLGSNIGNFSREKAAQFCSVIREHLSPGDMFLVGFDLVKNPKIILDAYNDKAGITRQFNLNLLRRINREMDADFDTDQFDHFPTYDPETGSCKSFVVSLKDQVVRIGEAHFVSFKNGESILTEICQKYTIDQISHLAALSGYKLVNNFYDSKKWFVDTLWECI